MSIFSNTVESLRPSTTVSHFMEYHLSQVENKPYASNLTTRFIKSRSLLHIPFHSEVELMSQPEETALALDLKLILLGAKYKEMYDHLIDRTGLEQISSVAKVKGKKNIAAVETKKTTSIIFSDVPGAIAKVIHDNLHYIRRSRSDSILNTGLYLPDAKIPYAVTSFSECNRDYQVNALNRATGLSLTPDQVLNMNRAFAFDTTPINSMSKLFYLSHEEIKKRFPTKKAVVTALNPFLGFNGGVFTGSSYAPYALAPMEYWYDKNGLYAPRNDGVTMQKMETPPIIWLAHGLDSETAEAMSNLSPEGLMQISKAEYRI